MERQQDTNSPTVRLDIDAPLIPLHTLVSAAGTFANLVTEVARTLRGESVEWTVEVERGSIRMPVRPQVPADIGEKLVDAITDGMASVEERAERPPFFSDRALTQARALANLSTAEIPLRIAGRSAVAVTLTKQTVAHVDQLTRDEPPRIGTIEGYLESVNIHGRRQFAIWERATGARVECVAEESVTLDELRHALGRRVAVRGRIRSSGSADRRRIEVMSLHTFPPEDELPSPDDVLGILRAS